LLGKRILLALLPKRHLEVILWKRGRFLQRESSGTIKGIHTRVAAHGQRLSPGPICPLPGLQPSCTKNAAKTVSRELSTLILD
jgi:hypothetical protein